MCIRDSLYPNPWPKAEHLKRRWHAHPVFPKILKTTKKIILRTDWEIYAEEFKKTLEIHKYNSLKCSSIKLSHGISRFEQKFIRQNRKIYELICHEKDSP